jgi:hypothetical protein
MEEVLLVLVIIFDAQQFADEAKQQASLNSRLPGHEGLLAGVGAERTSS